MSSSITSFGSHAVPAEHSHPAYQAYQILHIGFVVAPVIAGLDKFFQLLCNWDMYLAPWVTRLSPLSGHTLMRVSGLVEIAAGILVALKPRYGAPLVAAWLCLIIVNLVSQGAFLDIALRDLGLALGALALSRLALEFDKRKE